MCTDIGSHSESEEFAEPSSAVTSALDKGFDDDTDRQVDINIALTLSANKFGADMFIVMLFVIRLQISGPSGAFLLSY